MTAQRAAPANNPPIASLTKADVVTRLIDAWEAERSRADQAARLLQTANEDGRKLVARLEALVAENTRLTKDLDEATKPKQTDNMLNDKEVAALSTRAASIFPELQSLK